MKPAPQPANYERPAVSKFLHQRDAFSQTSLRISKGSGQGLAKSSAVFRIARFNKGKRILARKSTEKRKEKKRKESRKECAWRERYHEGKFMANMTTREKLEAGMHGMVARISPRNRMPGSRTLKFESVSQNSRV